MAVGDLMDGDTRMVILARWARMGTDSRCLYCLQVVRILSLLLRAHMEGVALRGLL